MDVRGSVLVVLSSGFRVWISGKTGAEGGRA